MISQNYFILISFTLIFINNNNKKFSFKFESFNKKLHKLIIINKKYKRTPVKGLKISFLCFLILVKNQSIDPYK